MVTDAERLSEVAEFADLTQLIIGHGEIEQRLAESAVHAPLHPAAPVLRPHRQRQCGDHLFVGLDGTAQRAS